MPQLVAPIPLLDDDGGPVLERFLVLHHLLCLGAPLCRLQHEHRATLLMEVSARRIATPRLLNLFRRACLVVCLRAPVCTARRASHVHTDAHALGIEQGFQEGTTCPRAARGRVAPASV